MSEYFFYITVACWVAMMLLLVAMKREARNLSRVAAELRDIRRELMECRIEALGEVERGTLVTTHPFGGSIELEPLPRWEVR